MNLKLKFSFLLAISLALLICSFKDPMKSGSNSSPNVTTVSIGVILDFTDANNVANPTYNCGTRPVANQYTYQDSGQSFGYICTVKVKAENYDKEFVWKKGSYITVDVPNDRAFSIEVRYTEPQSSCYPLVSTHVVYSWTGAYATYPYAITAPLSYIGITNS